VARWLKIRWLKTAVKTRFAQLDYIAKENPSAVLRLDEDIERQIARLADNPEAGRAGRVQGTRELVIARTPFIAVYRVKARRVEILRVLHGAQRWPPPKTGTPDG
jgi:toxin ParE1/3/4